MLICSALHCHVIKALTDLFFQFTGPYPRAESSLLLDRHQLPEERTRAENASQSAQEEVDGWSHVGVIWRAREEHREGGTGKEFMSF